MRVGDLLPNKYNPVRHGASQTDRMRAVLDKFGAVTELVAYYNADGKLTLFDGHLRRELDPMQEWDVAITDLTQAEVDELVLYFDPLAGMADPDGATMAALMQDLQDVDGVLGEMLEELAMEAGIGLESDGSHTVKLSGLYNAGEGHDIEPFKLAYRLEAAWMARDGLALDLFSGQGQLATWYKRRFRLVVTNDKSFPVGDVDFSLPAEKFIEEKLSDFMAFDFVDFDDEGTPAREIQKLFEIIKGQKKESFILALTDGMGLGMKLRTRLNFGENYLIDGESGVRRATRQDWENFEEMVTSFVAKCAMQSGFASDMISSYQGRGGDCVYQTWFIEPG